MQLTLFFLVICGSSFAQKTEWTSDGIKELVFGIQRQYVLCDSLNYVDSNNVYYDNGLLFSGYVLHHFDQEFRFNKFENGIYFGEEWIFNDSGQTATSKDLVSNLKSFSLRTDTSELYTNVMSFFDFNSFKIHEIYIEHRFKNAQRKSYKKESFDTIFGGAKTRTLPYQSFYENGNPKEKAVGKPYRDGLFISYYENGKKNKYVKVKKDGASGLLKEFGQDGKCSRRLKFRNNKLRGIYFIYHGKVYLPFIERKRME